MRKFENIVQSETAPQTNSLWLKDGKLKVFNNGKWQELVYGGDSDSSTNADWKAREGEPGFIKNKPFKNFYKEIIIDTYEPNIEIEAGKSYVIATSRLLLDFSNIDFVTFNNNAFTFNVTYQNGVETASLVDEDNKFIITQTGSIFDREYTLSIIINDLSVLGMIMIGRPHILDRIDLRKHVDVIPYENLDLPEESLALSRGILLTQEEYDNLDYKGSDTFYFIEEEANNLIPPQQGGEMMG